MSIRLFLTMSRENKLKIMWGDLGNVFPNTPTNESICAIAGEEFGERQEFSVEMIMSTASRSFSLCLGDFVSTLECVLFMSDPHAWIKRTRAAMVSHSHQLTLMIF